MKKFIKKHKFICIALVISVLLFIPFIIFNNSIYIFSGDFLEQLVPIYVQAWNRLRSGSLPFWDWSNFLGANYYGSDLYYCLGSPFFWIAMLVPKAELIPYTFIYLYILKVILCISFTYMWLYKVYKNDLGASIGGLIVTFSGFVLANVADGFLFDGVVFCPLILYFVECFLQDKKTLGLSLSVALVGIVDYYILYVFISFVCLYALMRYLVINDNISFKDVLKDGLHFIFRIVIGLLISSFVLIPAFYALNNSPRADKLLFSFETVGLRNIYRFITSFFNPVSDWRQNYNYYISTELNNVGVSHCGGYSNYSLIISVFCVLPLLFIRNNREKIGAISLLGLYVVFSCFKMFYILLNQNYATRWMMVYPFLFAYIVLIVINNYKGINKKIFLFSSGICMLLLLFFIVFSIRKGFVFYDWEIDVLKRNVCCLSVILILLIIAFSLKNKLGEYLIIILVILDIVLSYINLYTNYELNKPLTLDEFNEIYYAEKEVPSYIQSIDNSFYRIDQSFATDYNLNSNLALGYKSFIGYHSLLNYNGLDFMNGRFTMNGHWVIKPQKGKDILKTMLGSKYWYIYNSIKYDNGNIEYESVPPYGYSFLTKINDAEIYINDYPITFGYIRNKTTSKEDFDSLDTLHQDYLLLDHVVLEEAKESDTNPMIELIIMKEKDNDESFYEVNNKGIIYISNQDNTNTKINLSFNDQSFNTLTYAYRGYINYFGVTVPSSAFYFNDLSPLNHEIYYDDMSWYEGWYNSQEMIDSDSVKWDDNSISGTITVSKDGYFVSSVPYDKGWTVKLDGEKIDYIKVNEGFIGFDIKSGTHNIEMSYTSPGLLVGAVISMVSLIVCILLEKKRKVL